VKTLHAVAEPGKVVLKTKELPEPGPGEVLLEAEYSALSPGTEYDLLANKIVPLPQGIGYAMVARVIQVGPGVSGFNVGDPVVTTGEHAQYLVMKARNVTPAPVDVELEQAAFFNLIHTGLYALRRSQLQLGEPVVVMGQGFVGAITAQLAKLAGGLPVIVTDLDDGRIEIAKKVGLHYAINVGKNPGELVEVVNSLNRGGVPVVFEATGARQPLAQALEIASERGRILMISAVHGQSLPDIDELLMLKGVSLIGTYVNSKPFALHRSDLTIDAWPPRIADHLARYVNSDIWTSDEDIRVALNLIKYGSLNVAPLISHRFSYEDIPHAYELVWKRDRSLVGGVVKWK